MLTSSGRRRQASMCYLPRDTLVLHVHLNGSQPQVITRQAYTGVKRCRVHVTWHADVRHQARVQVRTKNCETSLLSYTGDVQVLFMQVPLRQRYVDGGDREVGRGAGESCGDQRQTQPLQETRSVVVYSSFIVVNNYGLMVNGTTVL